MAVPEVPDFDRLLADASSQRRPVPLDEARRVLGDLFDEHDLSHETLVIRGNDYAMTPTTWVRVVQRAKTKHNGGSGTTPAQQA